ncbi:hypothetical protein [Enterobacter phage 04_vB_Eclo_IJM]|nr:hypothetical protein [Enterobacter phage 04_vB_Eclo_IJM]
MTIFLPPDQSCEPNSRSFLTLPIAVKFLSASRTFCPTLVPDLS